MEKEYIMQIAQTIKEQLIGLTPMPVLMSWGIAEFAEHHPDRKSTRLNSSHAT